MKRAPWLMPLLWAALALLAPASLATGPAPIGWDLIPFLLFEDRQANPLAFILWEIRLPRIVLACLIGAGLGMGGAVLQSLFHNPLADPGILGISAAAALGACAALYGGLTFLAPSAPVAAILAALAAAFFLFAAAARAPDPLTIILAGAVINALAVPLLALIMTLSPNPWALAQMTDWLLGSLKGAAPQHVFFLGPPMLAGLALMRATAPALDRLSLGEEVARAMGMRPRQIYALALGGVALTAGASVAAAGAIGFAGLLAPHFVRPFCAYRPRLILLPAALAGAILILMADSAARLFSSVFFRGTEIHIGIFTALLGAPFFLFLLFHQAGHRE